MRGSVSPRHRRRGGPQAAVLFACLLLHACSGLPRRPPPPGDYSTAVPPGFPASIRWFGETEADFYPRARRLLGNARVAAHGGRVNVLVLSGGGAGGAFGAGALVGWSRLHTRPSFQVVTGVSAGALIAPFAFLGPAWDPQLTEAFSLKGASDLQELHEHFLHLLFGVSYFRAQPLADLVNRYVTPGMVAAIARQAAKGNVLVVATTDLDTEQTVFWNIGQIAEIGGRAALRLIRQVLLASASVPGFFPPVMISVVKSHHLYSEMHVDGATGEPLFFIPDLAAILPGSLSPLVGGQIFVMVNGPLHEGGGETQLRAMAILRHTIGVALQSGTRAAVETVYSFAVAHRMRIVMTSLPGRYPFDGPLDFNRKKMQSLFAYGERCALAGKLWLDPIDALERAAVGGGSAPEADAHDIEDMQRCPAADRSAGGSLADGSGASEHGKTVAKREPGGGGEKKAKAPTLSSKRSHSGSRRQL